jgi:hypothetical protein
MPNFLKNRSTWVGVAMFLVAGCHAIRSMVPALSTIDDQTWQDIMKSAQLGGTGLAVIFLRSAMAKLGLKL